MADAGFVERFDHHQDNFEWHHVTGGTGELRQILQSYHFSGASYDESDSQSSRAEFDDMHRFYSVRIFDLVWNKDQDAMNMQSLTVWANHGVVISYAPDSMEAVKRVRDKLNRNPKWVPSTERLIYYLFDEILGGLFTFLDMINDRIAGLEQQVFRKSRRASVQSEIFQVKREVLKTRRTLASMRDAISQLVRYWTAHTENNSFYYMELYDHMIRLFDTIDTYRELINSVLDLYLSSVSNRLNEIVKTLTLVTTVLLPASLMAALYGMNFDYLPLAHYRWGFLIIMGIIGTISLTLYWFFRRRRWL